MGIWYFERMKYERSGRIILRQVAVHIYSFDGVQRSNYFGGELIRSTEVEVRAGRLEVRMRSLERW